MLFNSLEFLVFLPIVFFLYWFVCNRNYKIQNTFIVVASYIFYGWWDWRFLLLIAFTSLCSWLAGLCIEKHHEKAKLINACNIILNLTILGIFKYYDFFVQSFADAFLGGNSEGLLLNIILPVGISFYTFQALSYSIDVYKGKISATKDMIQFFAFVSFFPQLVAGPIERATNLLPQFAKPRTFEYSVAVDGCRQMLWGFFKKIVIADNCAPIVDQIFSNYQTINGATLLIGAVLFSFQIYGDFSGYSDIAIGVAKLFGIQLKQNFSIPYFSRDIAEFWRRWHISLTTWFRDYVYIPLGGSRCSKIKVARNTMVIFLLSGLWHGANWTFIVWGMYHALLFLPLIMLGKNRKYTDTVGSNSSFPSIKECAQMCSTFLFVALGWIIFRSETIVDAYNYIAGIFDSSFFEMRRNVSVQYNPILQTFAFIVFMVSMEWMFRRKRFCMDFSNDSNKFIRIACYYALLFAIFMFGAQPAQFIYFQF